MRNFSTAVIAMLSVGTTAVELGWSKQERDAVNADLQAAAVRAGRAAAAITSAIEKKKRTGVQITKENRDFYRGVLQTVEGLEDGAGLLAGTLG